MSGINTRKDISPVTGKEVMVVGDASPVADSSSGVGVFVSAKLTSSVGVGVEVDVWAMTENEKKVKTKTRINKRKIFLCFFILYS